MPLGIITVESKSDATSDLPSVVMIIYKEISIFTLGGVGCYFFLFKWLSIKDKTLNTNNNKVKISIVFIGITPFM